MVSRIRRAISNLDTRFLPAILTLAIFGGIIWALDRSARETDPQVLQLTIDAASTQANLGVPTLSANLTRTPLEAALTGAAPTLALAGQEEIRQYAASATANSQVSELDWGAVQAAGPPDTSECGDFRSAWATAQPNVQGVLTLYFAQLVKPTGIVIHQSFNPGFITLVTITDIYGESHIVYQDVPRPGTICPSILAISVPPLGYGANVVTIFVDQITSISGSNQIDAVELIGIKY